MTSRDFFEEVAKEKGHQILQAIEKSARTTFPILNDYEGNWLPNSPFSVVRHTRSWVYYQGVSTVVPITILGQIPLPPTRRIKLQRRGWRTGMFGWKAGSVMGGKLFKEKDVTPQAIGNWENEVSVERRQKFDKDVSRFINEDHSPKTHLIRETDFVRIPVSSGDGYFRLVVYPTPSSHSIVAATGVFRLGSLSPNSSSVRGASLGTMTPELVLKTASSTIGSQVQAVGSQVQSAVYTALPMVQAFETIPGTTKLSGWALDTGYRRVAGSETQEARYRSLDDVGEHLQDRVHDVVSAFTESCTSISSILLSAPIRKYRSPD